MIETVKCSDAFEEPGVINITCDIETSDTVNTFRDVKIVRIQDTLCNSKRVILYPYDCEHIIVCDKKNHFNSVKEVRACDNNACYDDQSETCSPCSPSRGCPITDIFFSDRHSTTIGGQLDIVCIVEDFKGLTDIKITGTNEESVSSIKSGDNIPDFNTISNATYVNETHGMLTIHVVFLQCHDKTTYLCSPEGTGDVQSENEINLDYNF
ncbi:uncharacterized protein LOC132748383 [Ruditapes philippinarum]|uniref:uncharacterized protein LOC132748383 n=1 Tax=Ruditapes philippinarum TaxID=129788 RepID=UPI00295B26B9|nr:uncharacterized protein LOC132748383 [Ruditapes philippinarum]